MNSKFLEDPDWHAFLYVADELTDEQRNEFEQLLLDDQSLREAVARSVALTSCLASQTPNEPSPQPTNWVRTAFVAAITVAVCLALMFLIRSLEPSRRPVAQQPGPQQCLSYRIHPITPLPLPFCSPVQHRQHKQMFPLV